MKIDLHLGDCLELLKSIPENSIDAIICDPPYSGLTQCDWDETLPWDKVWVEYQRIIKPNKPILLFAAQPFTSSLIMSNIENFKTCWYYEREKGTNFFKTAQQPLRVIEEICVFAFENKYTYNPQMVPLDKPYRHTMPLRHSAITGRGEISKTQTKEQREYKWYTHSHPKNLLKFSRDNGNKSLVPTQKPLALLEYLVNTYSETGDTILDNCLGSGTTGVACKILGRNFIGMEKNEKHYEIAANRIAATPEWIGDLISD